MTISLFSAAADPASRAIVIGGMHRSGTSLLASLFEGAGVSVGERLLGHGNGNEAGHFEDLDFQEFHERVLVGNGLSSEGFTADTVPVVPEALRVEAARLAEARQQRGGTWGWKDPRTILFLDFWAELLPDARYVFVFRRPWEVADSFFRRGDPAFVFNPPHAARVWLHYNRLILQFIARHRDRCLVREMTQVVADPHEVFAAVRDRLGVSVGEPPARYRAELLHTTADGVQSRLVAASCPEAIDVYLRLRELAGSTAAPPADITVSLADLAVMQWARASRMEQDNAAVRREWVGQQAALTHLRTAVSDIAHRPDLDPAVASHLAELGGGPAALRAA